MPIPRSLQLALAPSAIGCNPFCSHSPSSSQQSNSAPAPASAAKAETLTLTVAITNTPALELSPDVPLSLFSSSMKGMRCATDFFITRADLMTCKWGTGEAQWGTGVGHMGMYSKQLGSQVLPQHLSAMRSPEAKTSCPPQRGRRPRSCRPLAAPQSPAREERMQ